MVLETLKARTISGAKWNILSMSATALIRLATLAILCRLLGPGNVGLMGMVMVVISLAETFADAGLSNALIQRQNVSQNDLSSMFWCNLFLGGVLCTVILVSRGWIAAFFEEPRLDYYLIFASLIFLIGASGQMFTTLLQKELRFKSMAKIELIGTLMYALTAISLALRGMDVMSMIIGQIVRNAVMVLLLWATFWNTWRPRFHFSFQEIRQYMRFGLFQTGQHLAACLMYRIDTILIGKFLGKEALGFYSLAYQMMVFPLTKINPVVTRVAFPAFSRLQHDNALIRGGYEKLLRYLSVVVFPLVAGMFVLAPEFIQKVYGSEWTPSIILFRIFCPLAISQSLGNTVGSVILAKGRAGMAFCMQLAGGILITAGVWIGVQFGLKQAALGAMAAQMLLFIIILPITLRLIEMHLSQYLRALREAFICALLMLGIIAVAKFIVPDLYVLTRLMVTIVVGVLSYALLCYLRQRDLLSEMKTMLVKT